MPKNIKKNVIRERKRTFSKYKTIYLKLFIHNDKIYDGNILMANGINNCFINLTIFILADINSSHGFENVYLYIRKFHLHRFSFKIINENDVLYLKLYSIQCY